MPAIFSNKIVIEKKSENDVVEFRPQWPVPNTTNKKRLL